MQSLFFCEYEGRNRTEAHLEIEADVKYDVHTELPSIFG